MTFKSSFWWYYLTIIISMKATKECSSGCTEANRHATRLHNQYADSYSLVSHLFGVASSKPRHLTIGKLSLDEDKHLAKTLHGGLIPVDRAYFEIEPFFSKSMC